LPKAGIVERRTYPEKGVGTPFGVCKRRRAVNDFDAKNGNRKLEPSEEDSRFRLTIALDNERNRKSTKRCALVRRSSSSHLKQFLSQLSCAVFYQFKIASLTNGLRVFYCL
jgi:hypothetical protein